MYTAVLQLRSYRTRTHMYTSHMSSVCTIFFNPLHKIMQCVADVSTPWYSTFREIVNGSKQNRLLTNINSSDNLPGNIHCFQSRFAGDLRGKTAKDFGLV